MRVFHRLVGQSTQGIQLSLRDLLPDLAVLVRRQDQTNRGDIHYARRDVLAEVGAVADAEQAAIPAALRTKHGRVALPAHPLPVNIDAAGLQRAVIATIATAVASVRSWRKARVHAGPACGDCGHWSCMVIRGDHSDARNDARAAALRPLAYLEAAAPLVRRWAGGPRLINDLVRHAAAIEQAIDSRAPEIYLGPCTAPDVKTETNAAGVITVRADEICGVDLYANHQDQAVDCPACGTTYSVADRREWVLPKMRDVWARPAEIADSLSSLDFPITRNNLDLWISRDKRRYRPDRPWLFPFPPILAVGIDDDGKPLYRFGDVADRVEHLRAEKARTEQEATR
ncbi:MAG: hypothetical protein ACTHMS_23615 [Jatrophihabitans sp.]|uniref:hypothetical protein n=1 Tax=Jatrophihabitans sp. TaxID=1932789 RepID=UPI003F7D4589